MNALKACGVISEVRGTSARIKVLYFRREGQTIKDRSEIKSTFPPDGYAWARNFFALNSDTHPDFKIDALIEFTTSTITGSFGDLVYMDTEESWRNPGVPIFKVTENILHNEFSINQPLLQTLMMEASHEFYIQYLDRWYGPLKNIGGDVVPLKGKEVSIYAFNKEDIFATSDQLYIVDKRPSLKIADCDCMTPSQIREWLKEQVRNLQLDIDFPALKKALEFQGRPSLDEARKNRALSEIHQLSLSRNEMDILMTKSQQFKTLFQQSVTAIREELEEDYISPVLAKKSELEKDIKALEKKNAALKRESESLATNAGSLRAEISFIQIEKDRLIQDIKIQAQVGGNTSSQPDKFLTYEEKLFCVNAEPFESLDSFIFACNQHLTCPHLDLAKACKSTIWQLKEHRILLAQDIGSLITIAKITNNCKVVLQQTEADWLKFNSFYENGLKQIWTSAHELRDLIHFFILEDFNLASIECYGRPVLDLIDGIRSVLPGVQKSWPDNLWVFLVPVRTGEGHEFGLPLIKGTFDKCGALPLTNASNKSAGPFQPNRLAPAALLLHDVIATASLNEYFPD